MSSERLNQNQNVTFPQSSDFTQYICCVWLKRCSFDQLFTTNLKETAEQAKQNDSQIHPKTDSKYIQIREQKSSTAAPNLINTVRSELRLLWQILSLDEIQLFPLKWKLLQPGVFPRAASVVMESGAGKNALTVPWRGGYYNSFSAKAALKDRKKNVLFDRDLNFSSQVVNRNRARCLDFSVMETQPACQPSSVTK